MFVVVVVVVVAAVVAVVDVDVDVVIDGFCFTVGVFVTARLVVVGC